MSNNLLLISEIKIAEILVQNGQASKAIQRLTSILSQIEFDNPNYVFDCATILRELSRAAAATGNEDGAARYINQATQYLMDTKDDLGTRKTDLFLSIAETLIERRNMPEAIFFAESALHGLADALSSFDLDDIAAALHRYALVAISSGSLSSAYLALTVALLVLQEMNGLESLIATETAALTRLACLAAAPSAFGRIGCSLLQRAA